MRQHRPGAKQVHHPAVGPIELTYEAMELTADPGLTLHAFTAEPGSASADALNVLASWAATLGQAPASHYQAAEPTGPDRAGHQAAASQVWIKKAGRAAVPRACAGRR